MSTPKILPVAATHHVRDHCLCLAVQRAARALARRFDDAMRSLELTHGQFSLLMTLNRPEPPSIGAVAQFLAMDRTTLTANIKPLERRGLLQVMVDKRDRRSRRLMLTGAGHALLIQALPVWKKTHASIDKLLTYQKPDDLRKALALVSWSKSHQS
jgi:DNA-binding MarR family transcriptional regulator